MDEETESITFHTEDGDVTYSKIEIQYYLEQYEDGDTANIPEAVLALFRDPRIIPK